MKKKNSDIYVKKVSGNIIISQGQKGGVTAHDNIIGNSKPKGISFFKKKYVIIIGLVGSVLTILAYFGLQPAFKKDKNILNHMIEIYKNDTAKTLNGNPNQNSLSKFVMKKGEVFNKDEEKPISISNVTGDIVVSQNQTGGITAHTVKINKAQKRSIVNSIGEISKALKQYPIAAYRLEYSSSDPENNSLALEIDKLLIGLNWQRFDPIIRIAGPQDTPGITIYMLKQAEPMITLANQLWIALGSKGVEGKIVTDLDNIFKIHGWTPKEIPLDRNGLVIIIGPNPEN